LDIFN